MLTFIRFLFRLLWWPPLVLLVVSYFGQFHPAADSLAVFRPYFLWVFAGVSIVLFVAKARLRGGIGLLICAAAMFELALVFQAPRTDHIAGGDTIRVYQKNILYLTVDTRALETDIRSTKADIVTLQELHPRNVAILETLKDEFPNQHVCSDPNGGFYAVLTRWTSVLDRLPCDVAPGLAAMLVDTGRYRLWVGSSHLSWPWPYQQAGQVSKIVDAIGPLNEPMVLAGDFNMVAWSHTLRRLRRAGGMQLTGWAGPTFKFRDIPIELGIDHVFMPEGALAIETSKRGRFGSDHAGILAAFKLP